MALPAVRYICVGGSPDCWERACSKTHFTRNLPHLAAKSWHGLKVLFLEAEGRESVQGPALQNHAWASSADIVYCHPAQGHQRG